ncbi:alpha/beta hydrolase [Solibacillus cecembensis]|uniref:alpha/beta hydrolase n=1 Tax=Solibacillus cecembensis TaxID=459347 RepID=UPI003CFCFBC9
MKKAMSAPFLFEAGPRAVLLLHGFTGSSADVRILGRFLEKNGYTSHAPHYKGHGVPPEELIVTSPEDWWQDVITGYDTLKQAGYEEIAVAGLSLGGVFSLKLALQQPVKGVITMCSPMTMRTTDLMLQGVIEYAQQYKKQEGKNEQKIELEIEALKNRGMASLPQLQQLIQEVRQSIDLLYAPILVVQSRQDQVIDPQSANIIYNGVESIQKELKWFEQSGHVITLGKERDQLHEEVLTFFNSLDWTV